jgi:hypothetical protein
MNTLRVTAFTLTLAAALSAAFEPTLAFCGLYVARADGQLFNKASKVVLARNGTSTAITMASDYEGDPKDFALVIPVPTLVKESDIHVVDEAMLDRLDNYSEPRLVEYTDPDPCAAPAIYMPIPAPMMSFKARSAPAASAPDLGVKVEAQYSVEEYEIVILSAEQSDGLQTWLTDNGYKIPAGASEVLASYIKQKMHFFVAKVDLDRMKLADRHFIRPLQVRYDSPKFMLPIRLGTVNANGPQDLILMALTHNGRVETTNYQTERVPTGIDVPLYIKDRFAEFYRALFDRQVAKSGGTSAFLEYAWNTGGCDPCSAPPPSPADLMTLGADLGSAPASYMRGRPYWGGGTFITRLHVRYDRAHFPEDLALYETGDRDNFQGRYVMHHPFAGNTNCPAGDEYRRHLAARNDAELQHTAELTGWDRTTIQDAMVKSGEEVDRRSIWDRIFDK